MNKEQFFNFILTLCIICTMFIGLAIFSGIKLVESDTLIPGLVIFVVVSMLCVGYVMLFRFLRRKMQTKK